MATRWDLCCWDFRFRPNNYQSSLHDLKSPQLIIAGEKPGFSPAGGVTARTMDKDFSPGVLSLAVATLHCSATVGGRTLLAETMMEEESEAWRSQQRHKVRDQFMHSIHVFPGKYTSRHVQQNMLIWISFPYITSQFSATERLAKQHTTNKTSKLYRWNVRWPVSFH